MNRAFSVIPVGWRTEYDVDAVGRAYGKLWNDQEFVRSFQACRIRNNGLFSVGVWIGGPKIRFRHALMFVRAFEPGVQVE